MASTAVVHSAAPAAGAEQASGAQFAAAASQLDGPITRSEILTRARYWVDRRVPYSMNDYYPDPQGRQYRTDCSGFVSMAFHLSSSLSTVSLPNVVTAISWDSLKPGDIVGTLGSGTAGADGHVVIFNGWADSARTRIKTLEQRGGYGAIAYERERDFAVGSLRAKPYRYNRVVETEQTTRPVAADPTALRVFYADSSGRVRADWYSADGWQGPSTIASAKTSGPISVEPDGDSIYYTDADTGRIGTAWWRSGEGWKNSVIPGSGSNPVVAAPANGTRRVFFRTSTGQIQNSWYAGGAWQGPADVASAKTNGPISVQPDGNSIFYTDAATGRIGTAWYGSSGWQNSVIPGSGTGPVVADPDDGSRRVFFRSSTGQIQASWYGNGQWNGPSTIADARTNGPIAVHPSGDSIFYTDPSTGRIGTAWWISGTGWQKSVIPGSGTAPSVGVQSDGLVRVFFRGTDGTVQNSWWRSSYGWQGPAATGGS